MRRWLGVCAALAALAWPVLPAASAATGGTGGTFTLLSNGSVTAGQATVVKFGYTAPPRVPKGRVSVAVSLPPGWTASGPATVSCQGTPSCQVDDPAATPVVVEITLAAPPPAFTLSYPVTPPGSAGTFSFTATEEFDGVAGSMPPLAPQTLTVTCPDGAGSMSVYPGGMTAGQSTDLKFTYTAGSCGVQAGGQVAVMVPSDWPAPAPGSVIWPGGPAPQVSGWMITLLAGSVAPGAPVIFYLDMAQAPAAALGYTFYAFEQSSAAGTLQALASSPRVTVTAVAASSSASAGSASAGSASAGSASASAGSASASASSSGSASPSGSASGGGSLPVRLAGYGLGGLGLVAAVGAALLASRLLGRGGGSDRDGRSHRDGSGGSIRAVPHTGPPPSVTVRDTGSRPALTVRIEPRAGAPVTTVEEREP